MEVQAIFAILHKWGIHTLGQLAALDKEQLGARLGPQAICMWERANARSNRLLKLIRPPESFEERFEFEREIETAEPLLFMLRRFLESVIPSEAAGEVEESFDVGDEMEKTEMSRLCST